MQPITSKFPVGSFMHVRQLIVRDFLRSTEYDFFVLIFRAVPVLECLIVCSSVEQKKRPNNLYENEQISLVIEYSHDVSC
jgi:hypothetical protein